MKKIFLLIPMVVVGLLYSCEEKKNTTTIDSSAVNSSLPADPKVLAEITALRDSANKAWEIMIKSDDQKISDIARLLEEISYCKKYDATLLDSLQIAVKALKAKRYGQITMKDNEIDEYDEVTNKIIARTRFLASKSPELKSHTIAETLYNDIATADNDVARYRSLYDRFAVEYNTYLEANKKSLGNQLPNFPKLPMFSIMVS